MDNNRGEDDYNSSEIEFEERQNPFFAAGSRSITAIIDHALEDRVQSKKVSKTLTHAEGSRKTEYLSTLWMNRFAAFRQHTLKQSIRDAPTGADMERFLSSMISKITPIGNTVPSLSWIRSGFRRILLGSLFQYANFTLSLHERSRIKSLFHQLLKDGLITRMPIRDIQWIGAFLVRRMVTALLQEAVEDGTTNWDKVIQKALSIVLVAALSCRTGDITKETLDIHDRPFLCYDDVSIKLVDGNSLNNLVAEVVIRNEKSRKLNPRQNRKVLLRVMPEQENNILCPIKMLLISAMRLGAVQGTIEQVIASAAARRDKTIQWTDGRGGSPVLCGFETAAHLVIIDKPAMGDQVRDTVYHAGLRAGILKPIVPHDMRRGAARDVANLPQDPTAASGLATPVVAAEIGHTNLALQKGLTSEYVGFKTNDTWTRRVSANIEDPFGTGLTGNVYKKLKHTRVEWLKKYKEAGIDPSDRKATRTLREKAQAEHEQKWRYDEENAPSLTAALAPHSASQINTGNNIRKRKAELDEPLQSGNTGTGASVIDDVDDTGSQIDPRLRDSADNIALVIGNDDDNEVPTEDMEGMVLEGLDGPLQMPPTLLVPGLAYINLLSSINIISNKRLASTKTKTIPDTFRGNGKDEPTLFRHYCKRTPGCQYSSDNTYALRIHEGRCSEESLEKRNTVDREMHECYAEGCSKSFKTALSLKMHYDNIHDFQPRACKVEGCDPTVLYDTPGTLRKHRITVHPSWTPKECPVKDCECDSWDH
ncbi:hypothetical protein V494_01849 [Pseudogymnoascus sp. VKM F-4513 (FW-928)]|nr:hypothetical protein V494_01849 [Pseudogymnoascus sp. VKM F-4513 (FW-928)]